MAGNPGAPAHPPAIPRTISFALERNVTAHGIDAILKKLYEMAGCRTCGLVGFDVRLHVVDPAIRGQFAGIEGVAGVSEALRG